MVFRGSLDELQKAYASLKLHEKFCCKKMTFLFFVLMRWFITSSRFLKRFLNPPPNIGTAVLDSKFSSAVTAGGCGLNR